MGQNEFAKLEQELAEYSSFYENVDQNLAMEINKRDANRRDALIKAEKAERRIKRFLSVIFLLLCCFIAFTAYGLFFSTI